MTIEDRVEFLMHSIESHDRQLGELVDRMDRLTERVDRTSATVEALGARLDQFVQTTETNFDRLTTAMPALTDHVADHRRRIGKLEG